MIFTTIEPDYRIKSMTVTFETVQEYNLFYEMMGYNMSVPKLTMLAVNTNATEKLGNMMTDFRQAMRGLK